MKTYLYIILFSLISYYPTIAQETSDKYLEKYGSEHFVWIEASHVSIPEERRKKYTLENNDYIEVIYDEFTEKDDTAAWPFNDNIIIRLTGPQKIRNLSCCDRSTYQIYGAALGSDSVITFGKDYRIDSIDSKAYSRYDLLKQGYSILDGGIIEPDCHFHFLKDFEYTVYVDSSLSPCLPVPQTIWGTAELTISGETHKEIARREFLKKSITLIEITYFNADKTVCKNCLSIGREDNFRSSLGFTKDVFTRKIEGIGERKASCDPIFRVNGKRWHYTDIIYTSNPSYHEKDKSLDAKSREKPRTYVIFERMD